MSQCGSHGGKILSCCYCGVQSAFLPVAAAQRSGVSALICSTCGAPLAAQKARPLTPGKGASLPRTTRSAPVSSTAAGSGLDHPGLPPGRSKPQKKCKAKKSSKKKAQQAKYAQPLPRRGKAAKKRRGLFEKLLSEAVDLVEDIFD